MTSSSFETTLGIIGFTSQEASLYRALLEHGALNGYEAAKETGISRSNAYHSLASLVEKGFADRVEGDSTRYVAISPAELAALVRRRTESALESMLRLAPDRREAAAQFLSVHGREQVLDRMRVLLDGACDRAYLSTAAEDLEDLRACLEDALARRIRITILSNRSWELEGAVVLSRRKARGQVRLIVDGARVLTGELGPGSAACVLSENVHLVSLIKDSLTQEIELVRSRTSGKEESP